MSDQSHAVMFSELGTAEELSACSWSDLGQGAEDALVMPCCLPRLCSARGAESLPVLLLGIGAVR